MRRCLRHAWLIVGVLVTIASIEAQDLRFEGEDLASTATISGAGGILGILSTQDPQALPFTGGKALTFMPNGKDGQLDLVLPVQEAGVYRLRVGVVVGPACGHYSIISNGRVRGAYNLYASQVAYYTASKDYPRGIYTPRVLLKKGDNVVRFQCTGWVGRNGSLVIDHLALERDPQKPTQYKPTPFDRQAPAGERLGPELVPNGDFEDLTPRDQFLQRNKPIRGWSLNSEVPQERSTLVIDSTQAHNGQVCIRLVPDPLEDLVMMVRQVPMESGRRYRVTAWIRGPGVALIYLFQPPGSRSDDAAMLMNHFQVGDQWQQVSFLVTPSPSSKISSMTLALYGIEGGDIRFDDVSVREALSSEKTTP
jgi:hypothetical protein